MSKTKKTSTKTSKKKEESPVYWVKGDSRLYVTGSSSHHYEREQYVLRKNRFHLSDVKLEKSETPLKSSTYSKLSDGSYLVTKIELVGAPSAWLKEQGYTLETS